MEPQKSDYQLATIGKRATALSIEGILWMLITILGFYITIKLNFSFNNHEGFIQQLGAKIIAEESNFPWQRIMLQLMIGINLLSIIYVGLMFYFFGATIGKLCVGITVIQQKSGKVIGFWMGIWRDWVCKSGLNILSGLAPLFAPATIASLSSVIIFAITVFQYVLPFFNADKKALHDYFSGTLVIEKRSWKK